MKTNWIKNLKVGDEVLVRSYKDGCRVDLVKRVTKTLIVLGRGRFSKKTGVSTAKGSIYNDILVEPKENTILEVKVKIKKLKLIRKIKECDLTSLSIDNLLDIIECIEG